MLKVILTLGLIFVHQCQQPVCKWDDGGENAHVIPVISALRLLLSKHINPMFMAATFGHVVDTDRGDVGRNLKGLWHKYARHIPLLFFVSLVFVYHQPSRYLGLTGKWVEGKQKGLCRPWDAADPGGFFALTLGFSVSQCYNLQWWQVIWAGCFLLTMLSGLPLQCADILSGAMLLVISSSLVHGGRYNDAVFSALLTRGLRRTRVGGFIALFLWVLLMALKLPAVLRGERCYCNASAVLLIFILQPGRHVEANMKRWTLLEMFEDQCLKIMALLAPSVNLLHVPLREYITFYTNFSSAPTQVLLDTIQLATLTWLFALILNLLVFMPAQRLIHRVTASAALSMRRIMPHNIRGWKLSSKAS